MNKGPRTVTCRDCGVEGVVNIGRTLRSGQIKVQDFIQHKETCSQFVRPQPKHLKDRRSVRKQEARANALVGAKATAASGAANLDGDGRVFGKWRVESKQTSKDSFTLSQAIWGKLVRGALHVSEEPLLHVEIRSKNPPFRVCVMRSETLQTWKQPKWTTDIYELSGRKIDPNAMYPMSLDLDPPATAIPESLFEVLRTQNED